MRNHRTLGSLIEYIQAAKRLEEIANAEPDTPEAREYKELIFYFRNFELEIKQKDNQRQSETN
jgi:hypothetical protein